MKNWFMAFLILFSVLSETARASEVETLVETLKKTAKPGAGITEDEQEIAEKLQAIGPSTIPYLLPLLREKDKDVRDLASYTLRDMEGLTEEHLDALIESCRRGDGWIPPAIARIGTPKAVTFLVEELIRKRQTQTQVTGAIEMLGAKAVPALLKTYQSEEGWDDKLEQTMDFVFKELAVNAAGAVDPLLQIAIDDTEAPTKRIRAITALGSIGLSAEHAIPSLQKLRHDGNAKIRDAASTAILNIGSAEAAPILVEKLIQSADAFSRKLVMRDIAELQERGNSAGPAVIKCLSDDDWDVRVGAARALGYIGYKAAAADLIKLLNRVDDWRLVLCAAESLGKLKTEQAMPALSGVAKDHWYPPVRESALNAIKAIRDGVVVESKFSGENFPLQFFDYEQAGENMDSLDEDAAKLIRFPVAVATDQSVTIAMNGKKRTVKSGPRGAVKVEGGYLMGSDRGEWGGEITFISSKGKPRVIAKENTEAIYKTEHGIFAVTGLAHMTMNSGFIYRITQATNGAWSVEKWRALPGAPRFSRLLEDGRIFISCYGGIVLIFPNGDMKSLTRSESLR